jgi:hypothetical protein
MEEIINKVAGSGLVTIDLEEFLEPGERVIFDIKPHLFQETILREKDFRDFISKNDWSIYKDKMVAITCTADAIVPTWAYMLIALAMKPFAKNVVFGSLQDLDKQIFSEKLSVLVVEKFRNARLVIKGCGDKRIPVNAYIQLCNLLQPVAKSIMFGEPCSTVPLFKAKANNKP